MRARGVDGEDLVLLSQSTRVVGVKGASALGQGPGAFTPQGLFSMLFFFLFCPGTDTQEMYLLQGWFCLNAVLIPVSTDMQEIGAQRNEVTLSYQAKTRTASGCLGAGACF